jgi:hypothetical protein
MDIARRSNKHKLHQLQPEHLDREDRLIGTGRQTDRQIDLSEAVGGSYLFSTSLTRNYMIFF